MTSGLLLQLPVDKVPYVNMYWIHITITYKYRVNTNLWRITTVNLTVVWSPHKKKTKFFLNRRRGKKVLFHQKPLFLQSRMHLLWMVKVLPHFYVISVKKRIFFLYRNTIIHVSVLVPTRKSSSLKIRKLIKPMYVATTIKDVWKL